MMIRFSISVELSNNSIIRRCSIIDIMTSAKLKHTKSELLWGRIAAKTVYFMLGVGSGTFAATIPRLKDSLGLSPSELGVALLCCSLGGFVAMQLTAPLIKRVGLRLLLAYLMPLFPLVLILIGIANNFTALSLAFALFGAVTSIAGIAVNAHAIDIEKAYAKTIMSSFHALFSIGGLAGAAAGGIMTAQLFSIPVSLTVVALSLSLLGAALITKLFDVTKYNWVADHTVIESPHEHHLGKWWRQVILFGCLMFICFLCEGAIADWSAIYMKEAHGVGPVVAVFAYMIFNGCMTIGRLTGDGVIRRFGSVPILIVGSMMGVVGLSIGLLSNNLVIALTGFGVVGIGLSVLVPILVSMAGNLSGGDRNAALARVSTFGSIGLMTGPAVIGFIADSYSLLMAMMLPVVLLIMLSGAAMMMHKSARMKYQASEILG
ncbi:MAG: transporter [Candidatus Saccharibacteria bacterium]|jgi:predicted MFS family arabinose efflux permease|nr:transporter [Candidatus Saccharibacteria bacterium]